MKELIEYINTLSSQSFEGWSEDQEAGYRTALISIQQKVFETFDMRGYSYVITVGGRVATSGGCPSQGDPAHALSKLKYYVDLAHIYKGTLLISKTALTNYSFISGDLFGFTWEQIQDMQMGRSVSRAGEVTRNNTKGIFVVSFE